MLWIFVSDYLENVKNIEPNLSPVENTKERILWWYWFSKALNKSKDINSKEGWGWLHPYTTVNVKNLQYCFSLPLYRYHNIIITFGFVVILFQNFIEESWISLSVTKTLTVRFCIKAACFELFKVTKPDFQKCK